MNDCAELVAHLKLLASRVRERPADLANVAAYLEAAAAWVEDGADKMPATPTWKTVAEIFTAATVYE